MADPFVVWLFDTHWLMASLLLPWLTMFYAAFTGNGIWAGACFGWAAFWWVVDR
jgi:hypothetical protein